MGSMEITQDAPPPRQPQGGAAVFGGGKSQSPSILNSIVSLSGFVLSFIIAIFVLGAVSSEWSFTPSLFVSLYSPNSQSPIDFIFTRNQPLTSTPLTKPNATQNAKNAQNGKPRSDNSKKPPEAPLSSQFRPNATKPHPDSLVPLTVLPAGNDTSAVCLDGSPPAYYFSPGWGSGSSKWIVYLQSGAWCTTIEECRQRATTDLGSSKFMKKEKRFGGILSNSSHHNPYFFDWNVVYVPYCDGSSFSGTAEASKEAQGLHFKGQKVIERIFMHLMVERGMKEASHALLGGHSAGGVAALLHCDQFRSLFPDEASSQENSDSSRANGTVVKCLSDAGFFPSMADYWGGNTIDKMFSSVVTLHKSKLDGNCEKAIRRDAPGDVASCFFPENFLWFTTTPFFIMSPLYDSWFIQAALLPEPLMNSGWSACRESLFDCSMAQMHRIHTLRRTMIDKVKGVLNVTADARVNASGRSGAFLFACNVHSVGTHTPQWYGPYSPRIKGVTFAEAVGRWFFEEAQNDVYIDNGFPGNPTCNPTALKG